MNDGDNALYNLQSEEMEMDRNRPSWYGHEQHADMKVLDLGCGREKVHGSIGVDYINHPSVDVVHDLDRSPYPFENDTFDAIYMNHCIEHMIDPRKTLEECMRIARPGCAVFIMMPHFTCASSYGDVTHRRYFSYRALLGLAKELTCADKLLVLDKMRITARIPFFNPLINLLPRFWEDYLCFIITGRALFYRFEVRKALP